MATEHFQVVALPHSLDPGDDFHVSLFVGPDLVPDGDVGKLGSFTHFPHWASVLHGDTEIALFDQAGQITANPLLDEVDPGAWEGTFPPQVPVRSRTAPEWSDRYWRTFPAAELHDSAKVVHLLGMFSDPVSPPLPSISPLYRMLAQSGYLERDVYDESVLTELLDRALGERSTGRGRRLDEIEEMLSGVDQPLQRLALQLHRARRFYERPEAAVPYRDRPVEGLSRPPLDPPDPDFHERCAMLTDHPALQRTLGLVVDLELHDPSRLATSSWLSATIVPSGDKNAARSPRTRVALTAGAVHAAARTGDWWRGALRIGDPERFALLDVDPDGAALKLERYLWTLPRLAAMEANHDPAHAAPPAMRSVGFTVVRHGKGLQVVGQVDKQTELLDSKPGLPAMLDAEDVTQGMRVEVWDKDAATWFSLHHRLVDARADSGGPVAVRQPEVGFIEGTTATETPDVDDSPVHVHEAVFGWEGWSLSAPRPGKPVRHENGDEVWDDPPPAPPVTELLITTEAEPGTLPRLRYGRSYAFRAWAVDLAGNSVPHRVGPPSEPSALEAAAPRRGRRGPSALETGLRAETAAGIIAAAAARPVASKSGGDILPAPVADLVRRHLRQRRRDRVAAKPSVSRASLIARRFADVVTDANQPIQTDVAAVDPAAVASVAGAGIDPAAIDDVLSIVTPVRPFLRWNPVEPPTLVPRRRYSAGESLRQLVVRSGVSQDPETLAIAVGTPQQFANAFAHLGYRRDAQRHVAPPKTSLSEAELHGALDTAIGSPDPDDHRKVLGIAYRESGTLFDVDLPRLGNPTVRDPQQGIALEHDPSVPESVLAQSTLPLPAGQAPVPGQYVVHDVDQLRLPYLPDVMSSGISLVFPEAGRDRDIPFPFGTEGFTTPYIGSWPELRPYRLVLRGADRLRGEVQGSVVRISLPPGDVQRFRLSSSLDPADLDLLGPWRILPDVIRTDPDVSEAAADGWLWALTPFEEVTLVHAVTRPLEAPRTVVVRAKRSGEGATDAYLEGVIDLHGPSTEHVTAEVRWTDPVDDLSLPGPEKRTSVGVAFTTPIRPTEDLAVLGDTPSDASLTLPGYGDLWFHRAVHAVGDTRHHRIAYRLRAATRFREYFDAEVLAPGPQPSDPALPWDDGQSVVGPEIMLSVPSSSHPAAPIVHSVIPLFRWDEGTEAEQPIALRRRRRGGVRIYLERPWYTSGAGELLGVVVAYAGYDVPVDKLVSQWGADPVWVSDPVDNRALFLELDNLLRVAGIDDRPGDALPVAPPVNLPLTTVPGHPVVTVLGYEPQYNAERGLWYVDVAIEPGDRFWPFVRLSVVRYQPDSIDGCHLSAPVRCDFVQVTPERTASVSRTDARHVRVVVSGPVGVRPDHDDGVSPPFPETVAALAEQVALHRRVVARLQRRDPAIPTDLGWETVATAQLPVRGHGGSAYEAAWAGSLEAPEDIPLRRPGDNPDWRVTVEEWERLPGDHDEFRGPVLVSLPVWEQRLVYADEISL